MTSEVRPHGEASHRINGEKKCSSWYDVLDGGIILYPRGVMPLLSPQPFATSLFVGCLFGFAYLGHII